MHERYETSRRIKEKKAHTNTEPKTTVCDYIVGHRGGG